MKQVYFIFFMLGVLFVSQIAWAQKSSIDGDVAEEALAGAALLADGDSLAAGYHFTQALKMREVPALYTLVLLALVNSNDTAAVQRMCAQKTGFALRDPHFHYWCARFFWETKDRRSALLFIENAVSMGGAKPHFLIAAAVMNHARQNALQAKKHFTALIQKDPWILHARLYPTPAMGSVLVLDDWLTSGDFGARLPHALSALAMRASDPGMAYFYLQKAWKAYGTPPEGLYELRHQVLRVLGRTQEAETALDDGLRAYPRNVYLRIQAALRQIERNNVDRARKQLEEILADVPSSPLVLSLLAYTQVETAQLAQARKNLEYAQSQGATLPMFYFARALLQQKTGTVQAVSDFATAVKLEPTNRRFAAAYLAALEITRDAARIRQEQERQKKLDIFLKEIQTFEQKLQERLEKLEQLARDAALGKAIFPAVCDVQCQVIQGQRFLLEGKPWNPSRVLTKLATRVFTTGLPLHAWRKEARVGLDGENIVILKYFGSVLPMALD